MSLTQRRHPSSIGISIRSTQLVVQVSGSERQTQGFPKLQQPTQQGNAVRPTGNRDQHTRSSGVAAEQASLKLRHELRQIVVRSRCHG